MLRNELEKQKKVNPFFKPMRRDKPDYASKVLSLWQKKDLLTRTARNVVVAAQSQVKGSQYIPEVVDVCERSGFLSCFIASLQAKLSSTVSMHGYLNLYESHETGSFSCVAIGLSPLYNFQAGGNAGW